MTTVTDVTRMSHRNDPHTSKEAAEKVVTKKEHLYGFITRMLAFGPSTPAEVLAEYVTYGGFPPADLYDIRRRMTELDKDMHRIEPIQVGTHRDGSPQYQTRAGQRVMRLVQS